MNLLDRINESPPVSQTLDPVRLRGVSGEDPEMSLEFISVPRTMAFLNFAPRSDLPLVD